MKNKIWKHLKVELVCACGFKGSPIEFNKRFNLISFKGHCKKCKYEQDKKWRLSHKEEVAEAHRRDWQKPERKIQNRRAREIQRFGFYVTIWIRDKNCFMCGISNDEHIEKYGERLQLHHQDNNGRRAMKLNLLPNNKSENLVPICRSCHCIKTNKSNDYTGRGYKIWETRRRNARQNN